MKSVVLQTFRSSRIFAEGWNAARTYSLASGGEHQNPYPPGPEHTRWNEGVTHKRWVRRKLSLRGEWLNRDFRERVALVVSSWSYSVYTIGLCVPNELVQSALILGRGCAEGNFAKRKTTCI
jgi:hypothetical protein